MTPEKSTHYDYQALDRLLSKDVDPQEVGRQLDETMNDLVRYAGCDDTYHGETLEKRYYILRELRDIFWNLEQNR